MPSSTWDDALVRRRLADWAQQWIQPQAWVVVVDCIGFVKDEADSSGMPRKYSGTLGKTGNCQIGVSLHAMTHWASAAMNWCIFLQESWDDEHLTGSAELWRVRSRRARCKIPRTVRHRSRQLALDMLDKAVKHRQGSASLMVADIAYGITTAFRQALDERRLDYVVAVTVGTSACPADAQVTVAAWAGTGRLPKPGVSRTGRHAACVNAAGRAQLPAPGDLAPRHEQDTEQSHRGDALPGSHTAGAAGQSQQRTPVGRGSASAVNAGRMASNEPEPTDYVHRWKKTRALRAFAGGGDWYRGGEGREDQLPTVLSAEVR